MHSIKSSATGQAGVLLQASWPGPGDDSGHAQLVRDL